MSFKIEQDQRRGTGMRCFFSPLVFDIIICHCPHYSVNRVSVLVECGVASWVNQVASSLFQEKGT